MIKIGNKEIKNAYDLMAQTNSDVKELRIMLAWILLDYAKHELKGILETYSIENTGEPTGNDITADKYSREEYPSDFENLSKNVMELLLVWKVEDYNKIVFRWGDVLKQIFKQ